MARKAACTRRRGPEHGATIQGRRARCRPRCSSVSRRMWRLLPWRQQWRALGALSSARPWASAPTWADTLRKHPSFARLRARGGTLPGCCPTRPSWAPLPWLHRGYQRTRRTSRGSPCPPPPLPPPSTQHASAEACCMSGSFFHCCLCFPHPRPRSLQSGREPWAPACSSSSSPQQAPGCMAS